MLIPKRSGIFIAIFLISTGTFATGNTFPILSYNEVKHDTSEPITTIAKNYPELIRVPAKKLEKKTINY